MKKTGGDMEDKKNRPEKDVHVCESSTRTSFAIPEGTKVIIDNQASGVDLPAPDGADVCRKSTASLSVTGDSPLSTQVVAGDARETGEQLQMSLSEKPPNNIGSLDPQGKLQGNATRRTRRWPTAKYIRNAIAALALLPVILSLVALPPLIIHDRDELPLLKFQVLTATGKKDSYVYNMCRSDLSALLLSTDLVTSIYACEQYRQFNRIDEAEALLQNAIKVGTASGSTYFAYARCRIRKGNSDASTIAALEKAIEFSKTGSPTADQAAYNLLLLGCGDSSRLAAHLSPNMRATALAISAQRDGKLKAAQAYFNQAVAAARSHNFGCLSRRALFYLSTNQLNNAKRDIDAALNIDSTDETAHLDLGWYYLLDKKLDLALEESDVLFNSGENADFFRTNAQEHCCAAWHKLRAEIFAEQAKAATSRQERQRLDHQSAAELAQLRKSKASGELFIPLNIWAKQHNQRKSAGN